MDGLIIAIGNFISGDRGGGGVIPPIPSGSEMITEIGNDFLITEIGNNKIVTE
jgi:hypothetical protein